MSEWRKETSTDLADAARRVDGALHALDGEPTSEQVRSIWTAYVEVEKSIAFIKFDLDEDSPGRFVRLKTYAVPDERQALQFALKNLKKGEQDFSLGDFRQALKSLRECRNYLRALLREQRLKRARRARAA